MTAIANLNTALDALTGKTLDNATLLRVADTLIYFDPYNLAVWLENTTPAPTEENPNPPELWTRRDPTNEEKAEVVRASIVNWLVGMMKDRARTIKLQTDMVALNAAAEAEADIAALDLL